MSSDLPPSKSSILTFSFDSISKEPAIFFENKVKAH
jgi:hypothetical protein